MNTKTKFRLKKQIKTYFTFAWVMVGFFLLYVTVIGFSSSLFGKPLTDVFASIYGTESKSPIVLLTAIALLVIPIFGGMMFTMLSQFTRQKLYSYKNNIHRYRARKFFHTIMKLIEVGEIQKAVNIYKSCHFYYEPQLDDYLYGIIITECRHNKNINLNRIATNKFKKLEETFSPDEINLN